MLSYVSYVLWVIDVFNIDAWFHVVRWFYVIFEICDMRSKCEMFIYVQNVAKCEMWDVLYVDLFCLNWSPLYICANWSNWCHMSYVICVILRGASWPTTWNLRCYLNAGTFLLAPLRIELTKYMKVSIKCWNMVTYVSQKYARIGTGTS